MIEKNYDLRNTIIVSNSDGGSGYEKEEFEAIIGQTKRHEHFKDTYHVNRKFKVRLSFDKKMSGIMIKSYDWNKVLAVLDSVESRIDDPEKGSYSTFSRRSDRRMRNRYRIKAHIFLGKIFGEILTHTNPIIVRKFSAYYVELN